MSVEKQEERTRRSETAAPAAVYGAGLLCPRCRTPVRSGKKFCSQCGSPVGAATVTAQRASHQPRAARLTLCPECGFENHRSDRFCKGCGSLLIVFPAQIRSSDQAGSHSNGSKGAVPAPIKSAPDPKPVVLSASLQAAAVREAVAGLDAIIAPEVAAGGAIDTPPPGPVDARQNDLVFAPGGLSTSGVAPETAPVATPTEPDGQSAAPDAHTDTAKSPLLGARSLGVAAAAALVLLGMVVFSTRHEASKRLLRNAAPTAVALAASPGSPADPPASATSGPRPENRQNRSSVPTRDKISGSKSREVSAGSARRRVNASDPPGDPAPAPEETVANLDPSPKTPEPALGVPQPPALKIPSNASAAPQLTTASILLNAAPPQQRQGAAPTISATVAALPASVLSSAETEAVRVMDPAANAPKFRVGGVVQAAKLLAHPSPAYPPDARDRHLQGVVHVIVTVRKDGTVGDVRVASGEATLAASAVHAVRQWSFHPALLNGQPVQSQTDVAITFHLAN